jgi:hypothetical protein
MHRKVVAIDRHSFARLFAREQACEAITIIGSGTVDQIGTGDAVAA